MKLYAVRDEKAEQFGPLMQFANDTVAIRAFGETASDPQTMIHRYPEDFALYCLGTFDHDAKLAAGFVPVGGSEAFVVMTGAAWKAAQQPEGEPRLVKEA